MASVIVESADRIAAKQDALKAIFDKYDGDFSRFTADEAKGVKALNDELQDLGKKHSEMLALQQIADATKTAIDGRTQPRNATEALRFSGDPEGERKGVEAMKTDPRYNPMDIGRLFVESAAYKDARDKRAIFWANEDSQIDRVSMTSSLYAAKTVMLEGGPGYAPANPRTNIVIPSAQQNPVVADLIPQSDTQLQLIRYMTETTFTNAAAPVAEGATKPESALAFTEVSSPVQVIAHFIPVTVQQLEDVPGLQDLINQRLTLMLLQEEDQQLLTGNGSTPQIQGFATVSGIQTQARGTDPGPDALFKGITLIRYTGFANPSGIVLHPTDWQNIRLLRTADGVYIWGSPADQGVERIWGLPVVQTTYQTQGTGLIGDFRMYSHISRRSGLRIDVSNSHSDFFIRNQLAIRVEERLSLEIYRGAAFCKVTGL